MIGRERERERERQREKQAPCREPDAGLDPGTPRSFPESKVDTQPLSHPGVPKLWFLKKEQKVLGICPHFHLEKGGRLHLLKVADGETKTCCHYTT